MDSFQAGQEFGRILVPLLFIILSVWLGFKLAGDKYESNSNEGEEK